MKQSAGIGGKHEEKKAWEFPAATPCARITCSSPRHSVPRGGQPGYAWVKRGDDDQRDNASENNVLRCLNKWLRTLDY
jgi:hypothetical protein